MERVCAVVVTYNRQDLLVKSLTAVAQQTRAVDRVVVVDNASTDDTASRVRNEFPQFELHKLSQNTGGAGGFAAGMALALADKADLVWLLDDDTIPQATALEKLLEARSRYEQGSVGLVASRVIWTDGRDHPMNTPRRRPGATKAQIAAAAAAGCVPIRSASFVSALVDASTTRTVGLPEAGFFLWNDDFEFTTRVLRHSVGLYCPASVVEHHTQKFGSTDQDPGERFYFEVRNKAWTFLHSPGLSTSEKFVYGASTLKRWGKTFFASKRKDVLRGSLRRGLRDGIQQRPPSSEELLGQAGVDDGVLKAWRQ